MITVQLNGGLGNQLFQYSAAKALSFYHDVPLVLEVSSFNRIDLPDLEVPRKFELYNFKGVTEPLLTEQGLRNSSSSKSIKQLFFDPLLPKHKRVIYKESEYSFNSNFFKTKKDVFLKGQWQSERYFLNYKQQLRGILQLKDEYVQNTYGTNDFFSKKQTVAVHVRRGDYLRKQIILEWHGVLDKVYYAKAFEMLSRKLGEYEVLYFSDEPEWVEKELLPLRPGRIFFKEISKSHLEDFYLMTQCRHNIIANSSFSWWAAWLNKNPDKIVVAPHKWFDKAPLNTKDLLPESWIKV